MGILIVLFIAVPIAEIYVIIKVGEAIGILPTIALLIADAVLGSMLLRHQGRTAWRRFNDAIAAGRFPGREAADGVMVAVGGTLLLTPGFISDVVGLLLLIPPTRSLIRSGLFRYLRRRFVLVGPADAHSPPGGGYGDPATRAHDFEGTASEVPGDNRGGENADNGTEHPSLPPS